MTPKPPSPTKTTEPLCAKPHVSFENEYLLCQLAAGHKGLHSAECAYGGTLQWHDNLAAPSPKPSAEGTPFVDEVRRIVQETGCDEASAKARILREAAEGAVEITSDWKVKPSAEGTAPECICAGNWRKIISEVEPLIFFGVVHGDDDYYYGFEGKLGTRLLSCVSSIEQWGLTPAQKSGPAPSGETRGTCFYDSTPHRRNSHPLCISWKPVAPEVVGTKEAELCSICGQEEEKHEAMSYNESHPFAVNGEWAKKVAPGEAVGRETREPTKSNVTTFSAATEKCATRIWDMYLKGSGLDVDMAFADLCREINDAMQSELSTLTALRELDKEAFEMLNTSETEGMRLVAELRATISQGNRGNGTPPLT